MRKLPLGWAEENVHGPSVSTTFRNPPPQALFHHTVLSPQASGPSACEQQQPPPSRPRLREPHRNTRQATNQVGRVSREVLTIRHQHGNDRSEQESPSLGLPDQGGQTADKSQSLRNTVTQSAKYSLPYKLSG